MKLGLMTALGGLALASVVTYTPQATACGGCFHPYDIPPEQASVVVAHRMAVSISPTSTVLWDQVQYAGDPADFAWVLPVKPGATLEIASDAWFEALDAATTTRVTPPIVSCVQQTPGGEGQWVESYGDGDDYRACQMAPAFGAAGCSASDEGAGLEREWVEGEPPGTEVVPLPPEEQQPVDVVHEGSVGPYETVTLSSSEAGAIYTWLDEAGYAVSAEIQPILDAYEADGFDFIALRLAPEQGVQQMKPVRVRQAGASPTLPLRMVAAGAGANMALTLFVISEGRYHPKGFPTALVDPGALSWDFATNVSNYTLLREEALAADGGRGWLTTFSSQGALLSPLPFTNGTSALSIAGVAHDNIADAYVASGFLNGETEQGCVGKFAPYASSLDVVTDPCVAPGDCSPVLAGQISSHEFGCGRLTDLGVALEGLHPADVWLTRLEANLPKVALDIDLELSASAVQEPASNWLVAEGFTNAPCEIAEDADPDTLGAAPRKTRTAFGMAAISLLGLLALLGRRGRRRR